MVTKEQFDKLKQSAHAKMDELGNAIQAYLLIPQTAPNPQVDPRGAAAAMSKTATRLSEAADEVALLFHQIERAVQ